MAVDKLVDSTQLDTDLTSVANAIRTKGGTSAQLAFPAGFVSAIDAIPTGGGTPTRTEWYRPPDWPDISNLPFAGSYGAYMILDTERMPSRTFDFTLTNTAGTTGILQIGTVKNGVFVVDQEIVNSGAYSQLHTITIPSDSERFIVLYLKRSGSDGGGGSGSLFADPYAVPVVELRILYDANGRSPLQDLDLMPYEQAVTIEGSGAIQLYGLSAHPWAKGAKCIRYKNATFTVGLRALYCICQNMPALEEIQFDPQNRITLDATSQSDWPTFAFQNCYALRQVDLSFCNAEEVTTISQMFDCCYSLMSLNMDGWNLTACTYMSNTFRYCYSLRDISLSNSVLANVNISFAQSSRLTDTSLINIANALPTGASKTLTLHATPKGRLTSIMGTVADGVFTEDASGTVTLMDFITNTKGWTVA